MNRTFGTPVPDLGPKPLSEEEVQRIGLRWEIGPETLAAIEAIENNAKLAMARAHLIWLD